MLEIVAYHVGYRGSLGLVGNTIYMSSLLQGGMQEDLATPCPGHHRPQRTDTCN